MTRALTEEEVSDIIYCARASDLEWFKEELNELHRELELPYSEILLQVRDPYSKSTPLHMACANGHIEIVDYLLSFFAPDAEPTIVTAQNDSGNTALHWACLNGNLEIIKRLCDHNADPLVKNLAGQDSIYQAENNDKMDVVDYLLERFQDRLEAELDIKDEPADEESSRIAVTDDKEKVLNDENELNDKVKSLEVNDK
ncbi:ankyrin repeat-containing domain protein [Lipomyces japonicus]|uniref:ankyrin repeat-containing domain protein n=1 Tax=Lipomyces japonicus TaxID=56871 RepID=UPI0034CDF7B6